MMLPRRDGRSDWSGRARISEGWERAAAWCRPVAQPHRRALARFAGGIWPLELDLSALLALGQARGVVAYS